MSGFDDPQKLLTNIDENEKNTIAAIDQIQQEFLERTNNFKNSIQTLYNNMRDEIGKHS